MKIIKIFIGLVGSLSLGIVAHESWHLIFSRNVHKICYNFNSGFVVTSEKGTGEFIPYLVMVIVFLLGVYITFKKENNEKDRDRW